MSEMSVSKFKAEALSVIEGVASCGEEVTLTKRGKPVARLVPIDQPVGLTGSVRFLVDDEELISPTAPAWDAELSQ